MNKHQRNIINLILNSEEIRELIMEERKRTQTRVKERMNAPKIIPYTRVGNEEQLKRLDRMFVNGIIDDSEYVKMRARLRGDRNA